MTVARAALQGDQPFVDILHTMLAAFYHRCSFAIVAFLGLTLPLVSWQADRVPTNNDLEIWIPEHSAARIEYEEFKEEFGSEEFILIALDLEPRDPALVEAVCSRLEAHPEFRRCWSPERMAKSMSELGVPPEQARERLRGLVESSDGRLMGIVALLSDHGIQNRSGCARRIHEVLEYCRLNDSQSLIAGTSIFVGELDRLGSREANVKYFIITLGICLALLFAAIRDWKLSGLVFGMTVWGISTSLVVIALVQGETNLILNSISVLVMIFTMSVSLHYLHYYFDGPLQPPPPRSRAAAERAVEAMKRAAWPSGLATLTTGIGVISLAWSDIRPVQQFAYAATLGSVVALVLGLLVTPALVTLFPVVVRPRAGLMNLGPRLASLITGRRRTIIVAGVVSLLLACLGLPRLRSDIDPMSFLPSDSVVVSDFRRIEQELTRLEGVEAVVDFGVADRPFSDQLADLRRIEGKIKSHPAVDHTLSLGSFFPDPLPSSAVELTQMFQHALNQQSEDEFTARDFQRWRISARIRVDETQPRQATLHELAAILNDEPVRLTGLAPLADGAQREIFEGFWKSVITAFGLIMLVMVISLKSLRLGTLAMLPNLWPVCIVFGALGWLGGSVDIAMLLSGSIALGIAVDGTFHFVSRYQTWQTRSSNWERVTRNTLLESGLALTQSTLITAAGLIGLTLSSFGPTVRFGTLMILMLLAALIGDLILLPALLSVSSKNRRRRRTRERAVKKPQTRLAAPRAA